MGEDLAAAGVDRGGRLGQICRVHDVKRFPLGVDAPQFTDEFFVGLAFPSVVQLGEVDLAVERLGDPGFVAHPRDAATANLARDGLGRDTRPLCDGALTPPI